MKKLIVLTAALLTFASTAFAQLGSLDKDLVFTPVTPCRIMDTRGTGPRTGVLVAGTTRTFFGISSITNYTGQGGNSPNCTLPFTNDVAALVLNFTVVTPDTGGYITAFPGDVADVDKPLAATVNFTAGAVVGNNATLKISQAGTGPFKIYTTSNTHVVADIVGYYAKPVATALECVTTTPVSAAINQGPLNGLYYNFAVSAACTSGYTEVALRCTTSNAFASATADGPSPGYCGGNSPVNTHTVSASRTCCRIPGR